MSTVYTNIASNKRKTWLLVILYVVIITAIVWFAQNMYGFGYQFVFIATGLSLVMSLVSYYAGDKVALAASGAQEVSKEDNSYIVNLVENLAITAGLPMPKVYVMQDPAINAFATGRDPQHASVAVTSGAIQNLEKLELEGVIAHELSHVGNYDIRIMTIVVVMVGIISILAQMLTRGRMFRNNDRENEAGGILMIVGFVLIILSPIISQLIQLAVSRRREYLADASGVLLTRYPEGLARALEKIEEQNRPLIHKSSATAHLFISNPFSAKGFANLFSTHPPIAERIKRLRGM